MYILALAAAVFELLLAGYAILQFRSNLKFLRTWATPSDAWTITSQTCLVVIALVWRGQALDLALLASAAVIVGCILIVLLTRHRPSRFEFLENIMNITVHSETRERTPFPIDGSIRYFPNFMLVTVFFANYLASDNQVLNAISIAGLSASVPVFAIKIVKEKRL
jgi:hypothetical protein